MGLPYSLPAGLPYSLQAGLLLPRTAADSGEPRTTAGRFWFGPGHSPDTGGSLPSILVQWCLGGPRDDGHWPRTRTARGWWRHRGPSPWRACRIPRSTRGKGDHGWKGRWIVRRLPSPQGKNRNNKKLFKKPENKNEGGETPLISVLGPVFCHGVLREPGGEELLWNTLLFTHSTPLMTLRLDTEAGKHRAFKGETKVEY